MNPALKKIRFNNRLLMEASQETLDSVYKTYNGIKELLESIPPGAGRAGWVYRLVEQHRGTVTGISCRDGCGRCCHGKVEVNTEEVEALLKSAEHHQWEIDKIRLKIQKDFTAEDFRLADEPVSRCVFLGEDQRCRVYEERPLVCRNHFVTTPKENCSIEGAPLDLVADLLPELIAAAYDEVVPESGVMAEMVLERL